MADEKKDEFAPTTVVVVRVIKLPGYVEGVTTTMLFGHAKPLAEQKKVEVIGESKGLIFSDKKAKDEGRK